MAAQFCFNFNVDDNNSDEIDDKKNEENTEKYRNSNEIQAEFINPDIKDLKRILNNESAKINVKIVELPQMDKERHKISGIYHLSEAYVQNMITEMKEYSSTATNEALLCKSDLIPSRYEGGMKIWDCSIDLVLHMSKQLLENKIYLKDKHVLELGCGAGLPGIFACLNGAKVLFQDYNVEVLKLFTIPNVALNSKDDDSDDGMDYPKSGLLDCCRFMSGGWQSACSLLEPKSFDIIVTSETLYNIYSQKIVYDLMKHCIKDDGIVLVASKTYYFGVGGGTDMFTQLVKNDKVFDITVYNTCSDGVRREIIIMNKLS